MGWRRVSQAVKSVLIAILALIMADWYIRRD